MTDSLVQMADAGNFDDLFRLNMFWGAPDHPPMEVDLKMD